MSKADCGRGCVDDGEFIRHTSPLCVLTPQEQAALFDELLDEIDWILRYVGISDMHKDRLTTLLHRGRAEGRIQRYVLQNNEWRKPQSGEDLK